MCHGCATTESRGKILSDRIGQGDFVEARGRPEFNCLLWMPPNQQRAGNIVLVDSTNFTTLFGGTDSLENFWRNLATMR